MINTHSSRLSPERLFELLTPNKDPVKKINCVLHSSTRAAERAEMGMSKIKIPGEEDINLAIMRSSSLALLQSKRSILRDHR